MKKTVIVMIGVPGSGKSTYARRVMVKLNSMFGLRVIKCSADDYFLDKDGVYRFNRDRIAHAHGYCKDQARKAMRSGCDLVVIDNTNTTHKERLPYMEMAKEWDYRVVQRVIGSTDEDSIKIYAQRNVHQVPIDAIRRMAERIKGSVKK